MRQLFEFDLVSEFDLWMNGLIAHQKHTGSSFGKRQELYRTRDSQDDLRTSLQITQKLCALCAKIVEREFEDRRQIESALESTDVQVDLRSEVRRSDRGADLAPLVDFWEFLDQYKVLGLSLTRYSNTSTKEFQAYGYVLVDQVTKLKDSDFYESLKDKSVNLELEHLLKRDIVGPIDLGGVREQLEQIFREFFRILSLIQYMSREMTDEFKFKKLMVLFTYCYFLIRSFIKLLDNSRSYLGNYLPELMDSIFSTSFALKMETRKVFSEKLYHLDTEKRLNVVYANMEDALGLLENALRESFTHMVRVLNPNFDELGLFTNLVSKYEQTKLLLRDLNRIYKLTLNENTVQSDPHWAGLQKAFKDFVGSNMKCLYFKDWQTFEQFEQEIQDCPPSDRGLLVHRLEVYVSTLVGEVEKRAVLSRFDDSALPAKTVPPNPIESWSGEVDIRGA